MFGENFADLFVQAILDADFILHHRPHPLRERGRCRGLNHFGGEQTFHHFACHISYVIAREKHRVRPFEKSEKQFTVPREEVSRKVRRAGKSPSGSSHSGALYSYPLYTQPTASLNIDCLWLSSKQGLDYIGRPNAHANCSLERRSSPRHWHWYLQRVRCRLQQQRKGRGRQCSPHFVFAWWV